MQTNEGIETMNEHTMDRATVATTHAAVQPTHGSGVSWAAIFAGAAGAAALSLILLILGTGLGMSSVSPWSQNGVSATTFGASTIIWLTITQLAASAFGGYIAGRLRSRWAGTHSDEVFFRDTAHGFLSWAVATLIAAAVLTSAIGSVVGAGANVVGSTAGAAGTAALAAGGGAATAAAKSDSGSTGGGNGLGYFIDSIFRKDPNAAPGAAGAAPDTSSPAAATSEMTTIIAQSLKTGTLSADDLRYAGQLVAQRTGLSQQDAEKRVNDAFTRAKAAIDDAANKAKEAADKARKATAYGSLWLFVSLLIAAFGASYAATYGGRRRDLVG